MLIRSTLLALALAGAAPALAAPHDHAAMLAAAKSPSDAVVKINGLICDFCVVALTKTFKRAGAAAVQVDLDAKELRLGFAPGKPIADDRIRQLVTDSGYNVVSIARKPA